MYAFVSSLFHREKFRSASAVIRNLQSISVLFEEKRSSKKNITVIDPNKLSFRSNKKRLSMVDISSVSVGQKDYQRSLFKIWQEIFFIPRQKRYSFQYDNGLLVF